MLDIGTAINNGGQVTGYVQTAPGIHAFLFSGGALHDLGTLGGTRSTGYGINASGQVVGDSDTTGNVAKHAFLYSGGIMHDLGTLGGTNSTAYGINDSGEVVGVSDIAANTAQRFLYSGGTMHDLGTLGGPNSSATGINAGALPPGLVLSTNGQLNGIPTMSGTFTATVTASNGTPRMRRKVSIL